MADSEFLVKIEMTVFADDKTGAWEASRRVMEHLFEQFPWVMGLKCDVVGETPEGWYEEVPATSSYNLGAEG